MKSRAHFPLQASAMGILMGLIACRPVFAIGWGELLLLSLLALVLLWPLLARLRRIWNTHQESLKRKQE